MKKTYAFFIILLALFTTGCFGSKDAVSTGSAVQGETPFLWENANVYFMLTDRFNNGDPGNDVNFGRDSETGKLRGFMGGDIKGITQKIEEGYFDDLGITALWFTPVVEQIHGLVDEGTGPTYGFHGYWAKDWTALDPNFGTEADLAELVETAHSHGIRVLLDVVINHTGPVTEKDPVWPGAWVRTKPQCTYTGYESTVNCTLVENLPDVKTGSDAEVQLPDMLVEKWKREGRYDREVAELDAFFAETGHPRSPRHHIIKWLTDFIRKYGIDGFRLDTTKHTEASVWQDLRVEADRAFREWKQKNPSKVLDDNEFFMVGEVYGYGISGGRLYNFGDKKVNYFDNGINSLINFEFKGDANKSYEAIFSKYSTILNFKLANNGVLNYLSSHDDGGPYDKQRKKPMEAATKLLLTSGASQVYYGDETSRMLDIPGTQGDATLRSFMNWDELEQNVERNGYRVKEVLAHWQKLGQFRKAHPAVGAGIHERLSDNPYVFKRTYKKGGYSDAVVVGLDMEAGKKEIDVSRVFQDGTRVMDYYSGKKLVVQNRMASVDSPFGIVLLGK